MCHHEVIIVTAHGRYQKSTHFLETKSQSKEILNALLRVPPKACQHGCNQAQSLVSTANQVIDDNQCKPNTQNESWKHPHVTTATHLDSNTAIPALPNPKVFRGQRLPLTKIPIQL